MGKSAQREASQKMAEYMKKHGIVRRQAACPINHTHTYSVQGHNSLSNHLSGGCGIGRKEVKSTPMVKERKKTFTQILDQAIANSNKKLAKDIDYRLKHGYKDNITSA